jgi:hypothetical protein
MYLWRSLPKGQLSAVLRWVCDARTPAAPLAKPEVPAPLPATSLSGASLSSDSRRGGQTLPR